MTGLSIGGLAPFSTVDMPGWNAAVLFCQGCPWRCRYCHNAHLRAPLGAAGPVWEDLLGWLEARRGFLDAVVFSGGEPLLQPGLPGAMAQVKAMGFAVGLHTGGCDPRALRDVLPLLAWIGLDLKAPRHAYDRITGVPGSGEAAWEALAITLRSGVPCELRTTWHPDLLSQADLTLLAGALAGAGARQWVIQAFRAQGCADPGLAAHPGPGLDAAFLDHLETRFPGGKAPRDRPGCDLQSGRWVLSCVNASRAAGKS